MNTIKAKDSRNDVGNLEHVGHEIWKDIEGYEGIYQVSNKGRVKRLKRKTTWKSRGGGFHERVLPEMVMSPADNGRGYLFLFLANNGGKERKYVHRLVAEAFIPNPENKPQVNHKNGIKDYNWAINLEWVTASENAKHASDNNLLHTSEYQKEQTSKANRGSNQHLSKFTESDIPKIRRMYDNGMTHQKIADRYDVHRETIGNIIRGNTWGHV